MLIIQNVKIYDLKESVIASGNAMRVSPVEYTDEEFKKGLERCKKLVNAHYTSGIGCHDNFLTGIRVSFDITYPQYISPELQRYHWVDIVTSSSKMHRLCKMDIRKCCNKYTDPRIIDILQEKVDKYNELKSLPNSEDLAVQLNIENARYKAFMEMVSNCPLGLELFMRVSTNYKQLQTIYHQRKNHRLIEDWSNFCKMIEELPYFNEFILGKDGNIKG